VESSIGTFHNASGIDAGEKVYCKLSLFGAFERAAIREVNLDGHVKAVDVPINKVKKKLGGFFSHPQLVCELPTTPVLL